MNVNLSQITRIGSIPISTYISHLGGVEGMAPPASTSVNISHAARKLNATVGNTDAADGVPQNIAELKDYINSINFRAVSPSQMNELASKLVDSGELSADQVSAFMGIENDTVQPKNAADKIDVMAHFKMMYSVVAEAAKSDSTLNFGVQWRQASIDLLGAIQSFASSNRSHIYG